MTASSPIIERRLGRDGLTLAVQAPEQDLAWLAEFFGRAIEIYGPGEADVHIRFVGGSDDQPHRQADTAAFPFTLDSPADPLEAWTDADGIEMRSALGGVFLRVESGGRQTTIRNLTDRLTARFYLMRVVREYLHNHALRHGAIVLHAAGTVVEGRAIAIVGGKGAGKTTMLLRWLGESGVQLLGNDRLEVRPGPTTIAGPVPTVASIRPGTRRLLPHFTERAACAGDFRLTAAERTCSPSQGPEMLGETWHLSPSQLAALSGCGMSGPAPLAAIVVLDDNAQMPLTLRALDAKHAETLLFENLVGHQVSRFHTTLLLAGDRPPPSASDLRERCANLAGLVPCIGCTRGLGLSDLARFLNDDR